MSYTRSYREIITVSGSKTVSVSYPASQNGGTTSATVHYTEEVPVNVNIDVDTVPFDDSVAHCNNNVNLLTGAVVATEAAQLVSIDQNSKKVGETIITGFFDYIRSEISQQIAELVQSIDAHLMHLKSLSDECLSKKKQMESDFLRISGRYVKIFDDLNHELSNRVYELDRPAFVFKKELDHQGNRTSENDLVSIVGIFGKESGELQSKICASIAKKRAFDTINKAKTFLWQQKKLSSTVQKCMLNESIETTQFAPVCFFETKAGDKIGKVLFTSSFITTLQDVSIRNGLIKQFSEKRNTWNIIPNEYHDKLRIYFNSELNKSYSKGDQHSVRVKEMIQKIANLGSVNIFDVQKN
ncbi:MAG: hypothetical protein RBR28_03725 [Lentimicrobium sp.]|jgi:hypothetical protein|nr:hypothetical protein [Lentimicrobium sp.]